MLNKEIEKILGEFNNSTIAKYYEQKGEKRAAAAALSKLRMEHGLASKMAKKSNEVGAPSIAGKASIKSGVQKRNGEKTIKQLLQWQIDNDFRVCDLERTDEWCNNISIALTGRKISKSVVDKIKKTLKAKIGAMSPEERSEKYSSYSFLGKSHTKKSKEKMRKKANKRVYELGDNYISKERREKMREENGEKVAVYFFDSNSKNNKGHLCHLFLSSRQAQSHFNSGSIQHVLKNRAKRFGADKKKDGFQGYYAEYISLKKYKELCKLCPTT
jgi:hypothetical protein